MRFNLRAQQTQRMCTCVFVQDDSRRCSRLDIPRHGAIRFRQQSNAIALNSLVFNHHFVPQSVGFYLVLHVEAHEEQGRVWDRCIMSGVDPAGVPLIVRLISTNRHILMGGKKTAIETLRRVVPLRISRTPCRCGFFLRESCPAGTFVLSRCTYQT